LGVASAGRNDESSCLIGKYFARLVRVRNRRIDMMGAATGQGCAWENISCRFGRGWRARHLLGRAKIFLGLIHVAHGSGGCFPWVFADKFGSESGEASDMCMSSALQSVERAGEKRAACAKATSSDSEAES
jgi:hypothetical protein